MTDTLNGHRPPLTVRDGVQVCVQDGPTAAAAPIAPDPAEDLTRTRVHPRVIPAGPAGRQWFRLKRLMSRHVTEARVDLAGSWVGTERPLDPAAGWRQVFPATGEVSGRLRWLAAATAGVFRALAVTVLTVAALAVHTRVRAGVALVLVLLISAAALVARTV